MTDPGRQSMGAPTAPDSPLTVVENLRDVTNRHDVDGIVACFAAEYRNETPVHPARSFVGRDQVRRNWVQILSAVPDVTVDILESVEAGESRVVGVAARGDTRRRQSASDGGGHRFPGGRRSDPVGSVLPGAGSPGCRRRRRCGSSTGDTAGVGVTRRVLVAGGTGRLGRLVVAGLAADGVEVRVLTRDASRADERLGGLAQLVVGDLREADAVMHAADGMDLVLAAAHGFESAGRSGPAVVDRDGNAHLVDAARAAGADLVLMSVVGASADSPFELFRMKAAAERYLEASGVPATVVRATAFRELWVDVLRQTAGRSGRPVVFGRGHNPINFVSVVDVAELVLTVIADPATRGETLEIKGPVDLTMDDLARSISIVPGGGQPRHVPRAVLHLMANSVGRLNPRLGRQVRSALIMDRYPMASAGPLVEV